MVPILGIDVGGVITDRINDGTDTSFFGNNYLRTTAVPGAFESIKQLVTLFEGRAYIVSKCGPETQQKTLEWFRHHGFFDLVGIRKENVFFCLERHEKAPICAQLKVTHFIDDRLEVLGYLIGVVKHLFLFQPSAKEVEGNKNLLHHVHQVQSWPDTLQQIRASL